MPQPNPFKRWLISLMFLALAASSLSAKTPPNIVFIALDDLNDWVGALGYEQAITPNMDRLAASGVNFTNAHTAASFCAPSRTALFTGRHAASTGCYTTQVYFHSLPELKPLQLLLQQGGYSTFGAGKLFHHIAGFVDLRGWDTFFVREEGQKDRGWPLESWDPEMAILPKPYPNSIFNHDRKPANDFFLEWGAVKDEDEEKMADTIRTEWACDLLREQHDKPFFVAVGLYTPHFPNYAPQKYFDLYDAEKIQAPSYKEDDLLDLPEAIRKAKQGRSAHHKRLVSLNAVEDAIHGYLACISYADAMLGRILDAIGSGPNADNTIVVLWSDHGYHHGEKFDWGKHTLWERTSNVPFMIAGPGIASGADIDATVSLIDLFPTVTELAGVADGQERDGISLVPVLQEPKSAVDHNVLLPGMKPDEYAIINRSWRYIHYADGGQELYQVEKDPNEWHNLASKPEFATILEELRATAPKDFAKPLPSRDEMRLVIDGQSFHWEAKSASQKRKN